MFSKYLDYSEAANTSHRLAQDQSHQKDVAIGQLKSQVKELKQLEGDFQRLNGLITALQGKYSLLIAERQRSSKEQRVKTDIDKKNIIDLREQIDSLRVQLQTYNLQIDDLIRDNTNLKRQSDMRNSQTQGIRYQLKQLDNKNARSNDENRSLVITIKGLKDDRKSLEDECEQLSNLLDQSMGKIKNTEKDVRSIESANARLEKTLYQAEHDHDSLEAEKKQKSEDMRRNQQKLKGIQGSAAELQITFRNLQQMSHKSKAELDRNVAALNSEVAKGRDLQARLSEVEAAIKSEENNLDIIIAEEERLRKEHFAGLDKNKKLNVEIDHMLSLIAEYELVNKELLEQIELFIDQDQRARSILNRREIMQEIIESTSRKITATEEPIKHLRY